jgi:hypothetical protein
MKWTAAIVLVLLLGLHICSGFQPFEFAKKYAQDQLLNNAEARSQFVKEVFAWESFFHTDGVGVNITLGVTYDGTAIDPTTGIPDRAGLHTFSAASKEFIHLSLLAWAVNGSDLALSFFQTSAGIEGLNRAPNDV